MDAAFSGANSRASPNGVCRQLSDRVRGRRVVEVVIDDEDGIQAELAGHV